ncbi:MAG: DNA-directed RNA polymerase subunit omega [Planctomycetaceae bacterium]|nr:DNA-directed RNA polymerase subunit omega [Planctomycetaceae bacterium]
MIEELKNTDVIYKAGGKFKLSALIQKRLLELMEGGRPLIENTEGLTQMEIVIREIKEGKIVLDAVGDEKKPRLDLI